MAKAKITTVQGKTAVLLPDEIAARFQAAPGATVYVRDTARGLEVTGLSPADENGMRDAERSLDQFRQNWRYAGG